MNYKEVENYWVLDAGLSEHRAWSEEHGAKSK